MTDPHPRHARLTAIEYRDANPMMGADTSTLKLHYTVNDVEYSFRLGNVEWSTDCRSLQLLALYGLQPSELGVFTRISSPKYLRVVETDDGWKPIKGFLAGGEEALLECEWFNASIDVEHAHGATDGSHGDGGPNPNTGIGEPVEENDTDDGGVSIEMTPHENTGVNVNVQ